MIIAANRLRIHQVDAALLTRVDHQLLALVVEDRRRDLHIQIALPQPLGIGRTVVVDQLQGLGFRILLHSDDAVAVDAALRIPAAVAGSRIHGAVELMAGPARPHMPPPAGPQEPTCLVARSYAYT